MLRAREVVSKLVIKHQIFSSDNIVHVSNIICTENVLFTYLRINTLTHIHTHKHTHRQGSGWVREHEFKGEQKDYIEVLNGVRGREK